jgi:hypothetical protein
MEFFAIALHNLTAKVMFFSKNDGFRTKNPAAIFSAAGKNAILMEKYSNALFILLPSGFLRTL